MAYSESVLARAQARWKTNQSAHERKQEKKRNRIYSEIPRVQEIDRQLRRTAPRILAISLQQEMGQKERLAALYRENQALQEEERALLTEKGYHPQDLEHSPLCPRCQDKGWQGMTMCDCLKKLCQEEQVRELSSMLDLQGQTFDLFRLDYYDEQVWPEFRRSPRENMEFILNTCRNYAESFGHYPVKNLFLNGTPGLGKTFLSACIARTVAERGYSVVYDSAPAVFARFETRKFSRDDEAIQQAQRDTHRYLSCDLLILDDLGSEFTTPFVQAALYEIINTRLLERRCTVISSNLNLEGIRTRYSPPIASRIEGEYLSMPFFGRDIRQTKKFGRS